MNRVVLNSCGYSAAAALVTCLLFSLFSGAVPDSLGQIEKQVAQSIIALVFLFPLNMAVCFFASESASKVVGWSYCGVGIVVWLSSIVVQFFLVGLIPLLVLCLLAVSVWGCYKGRRSESA